MIAYHEAGHAVINEVLEPNMRNSSNDLRARKENMLFDEIERYYQEAKKILINNK